MTARLALRVHVDLGDTGSLAGTPLVGSVNPVGPGKAHRSLLVPAGVDVEPLIVDVGPGQYVCEVTMPSGNLLNSYVAVAEGQTAVVEFDASDSPQEAYAWQRLIGNIESSAFKSRHPTTELATKQFFAEQPATLESTDAAPVERPLVGWIGAPSPASFSWSDLNTLAKTQRPADREQLLRRLSTKGWQVVDPVDEGEGTALYRFTRDGPVAAPPDRAIEGQRRFALVSGGVNAYLVALPLPWIDPISGSERTVEMMVEHRPSHRGSPISVTVRDPQLGSGLAYLAKGSLQAAAEIFSNAQELLFEKMVNPIGAAAGAYVLVGTRPQDDTWHQWVRNLYQWYEWLADGAILWASLQLQLARDDASLEDARTTLLEAFDRGVPLYSIGLHWLVEGLSKFAEDDSDSMEALEHVRRLARRVDMGQPFVVLRLNGVSR